MSETDDSWRSRIDKIKKILNLNLNPSYVSPVSVAKQTKSKLSSLFDRFWLDEINATNIGSDGEDHNKHRFYKSIKSSFKIEAYLEFISNHV